jgi:hypothetical protein
MKNIFLVILFTLFTFNLYSQVRLNVWDKSPRTAQTLGKVNPKNLPTSFESELPDGTVQIYEKWDVNPIKIETSTGQNYSHKPVAYKSTSGVSVLTYTENGWEGIHEGIDNKFYSLTPSKIIEDDITKQNDNPICGPPPVPNVPSLQRTPSKSTPQAQELTNADFYNPAIPINKPCSVYVEVSNDLHIRLGNNLTVTQNWVTNLFLGLSQVFANEGITVSLRKVYVWTTVDPYGYSTTTSSSTALNNFTTNIANNVPTNPEAVFKHLLTGIAYGGIAWIGGNSDGYNLSSAYYGASYRVAVSGISSTSLPSNPTDISNYYWPLYVCAHEMGHNLGSAHTQNCRWKNDVGQNIGRIDSCYAGESSTTSPNCLSSNYTIVATAKTPTIMSYCHLRTGFNKILANGFGRYPRFAIRSTTYNSPDIPSTSVNLPSVISVSPATNVTSSSAIVGGNVTSNGGADLTARGICWAVSPTVPTISNSKTNNGISIGSFTANLTGLLSNTTYIARAYATNSLGTGYGSTVTFTTSSALVPTISTTAAYNITSTTASVNGQSISENGQVIIAKGHCWSTSPLPTIALTTKTNVGTGVASYTSNLTNLTAGTRYYVRAYAQNSVGVGYGNEVFFDTPAFGTATVTISTQTNLTNVSCSLNGNISSSGTTVTRRGFCYGLTQNPDTTSTTVNVGSGVGSFTTSISNLTPGSIYYVRSFAINSAGISYSSQISFTTLNVPTVVTTSVGFSPNTPTQCTVGGNVTSTGGTSISVTRGVCYGTIVNPTINNLTIIDPGTTSGTYNCTISGLSAGVTYYFRAYATNLYGTSYGTVLPYTPSTSNLPTLTTNTVTSISATTALSGGNITSDGGSAVTTRGVVWSTLANPTISLTTKTSNGSGVGSFQSSIANLVPSTIYYLRAYATNANGTSYGNEVTFTTLSATTPSVTTANLSNVTNTTATTGGSISSDGGSSVTSKGVVWSTSANPVISLSTKTNDGSGTSPYVSQVTGLTPATSYFIRAYATNANGFTGYGNQLTFTTPSSLTIPSVTTSSPTSVTSNSANVGGNVISDGGVTVTQRGICYALTQNPTTSNTTIISGNGTGPFNVSLTGLTSNTVYFVRAYAINSVGTAYGSQVSFTTTSLPNVTTTTATSITSSSASTGGNVISDGGTTVTSRGVCYGTTSNPTLSNLFTSNGSGLGTFTSNITGLLPNTTYFVRGYATNSVGTTYGNQITFTTSSNNTLPTLTTSTISTITSNSAVSGGNITDQGGQIVTSRGICWSTSVNPTISLPTKTTNGSGTGIFTSQLSGLTPLTLYYVRAYATNGNGTAYGNQLQFTTQSSGSSSCTVTTFPAFRLNNRWRFKWNINPNCSSYTVDVIRYNYTNPSLPPPPNATPQATGNRLRNYVPTPTQISQGFIDLEMNPQPQKAGYWYNFRVTCNSNNCSGSRITFSDYFYTQ